MIKKLVFPRSPSADAPYGAGQIRANMAHNGRHFFPLPQRLAVRQRLCVSGADSISGIPDAVMGDSPPLNVSV